MASPHRSQRIASLDQFRGYTVAGMILVNFIGGFAAVHAVFKHNDNYFSFADSIMPSFHFAVGFSYRLSMLRRIGEIGVVGAYWSFIRRSLALVFIAVLLFGVGGSFRNWSQFEEYPSVPGATPSEAGAAPQEASEFRATFRAQWQAYALRLLKSNMWNTLAIIGVTQLVVLPFVAGRSLVRVLAMAGLAIGHALLCAWFNWGFVLGDPENWMVRWWGTGSEISWDGGFFGPLCWGVVMLGGTLAYDVIAASPSRSVAGRTLFAWGAALIVLAYGLSCLTRLYDVETGVRASPVHPHRAASPFIPSFASLKERPLTECLAEPPFFAPPPSSVRLENYWVMSKQIPTLTFILCATGFAFAGYALFVFVCDVGGHALGVFRTFGTNPLAAYCLHSAIGDQLAGLMPADAPLWYCLAGFAVFFAANYLAVRFLERSGIYIRL